MGYLLTYLIVKKYSRSYGYAHIFCLDLSQNLRPYYTSFQR